MFLTAEPFYLLCLDRTTGKILWSRSHSYLDARRGKKRPSTRWTNWRRPTARSSDRSTRPSRGRRADPSVRPASLAGEGQGRGEGPPGGQEARRRPTSPRARPPGSRASRAGAWRRRSAMASTSSPGFGRALPPATTWRASGSGCVRCPFTGNVHHGAFVVPGAGGGKLIVHSGKVTAFDAAHRGRLLDRAGPAPDVGFAGGGAAWRRGRRGDGRRQRLPGQGRQARLEVRPVRDAHRDQPRGGGRRPLQHGHRPAGVEAPRQPGRTSPPRLFQVHPFEGTRAADTPAAAPRRSSTAG